MNKKVIALLVAILIAVIISGIIFTVYRQEEDQTQNNNFGSTVTNNKNANTDLSVASWAIKFAANLDGVIVVLSGMSNIEQMEDNIAYMKDFEGLSKSEEEVIKKAQEELNKIPLIPCTTCNYCAKVCPMNIGISGSFTAMNMLTLYKDLAASKHQEGWLVGGHGKARADQCIKCGACEGVCPQHIKIRDELDKVTEEIINK